MRNLFYLSLFTFCTLVTMKGFSHHSTQVLVTMGVTSINEIACYGNPPDLVIYVARPGMQPVSSIDNSCSYAITTNNNNQKITAQIDQEMPPFTAFTICMDAPLGGVSTGVVPMTTCAQDIVTNIPATAESGMMLCYEFSAEARAGYMAPFQRIVTYTLTTEP